MSIPDRLAAALADRYRLEQPLGEGGMATVYRARDLRHDRDVAIKVLKPELAAVIGGERFLTEIRTTANLQHPHILPLFDSGEADSFLYYVMPYVDGESLRARLDRERQLAVDEALRITEAVASALEYAHQHGVIHRDIKPENILIHAGEPVVADFGIALAISAAGGGRLTETGLSLGTPHYMSPEQATADRDLTARSDVYSLACVLYEMLAGDPPHTGPTAQSILMRILTESPRPVTDVRASVPPNVAAALTRALEKLPADRFETADEFRRALDDPAFTYAAVRRTPPAGVPVPGPAHQVGRVIPVAWAAAGVILAALAGVAGALLFRSAPELAADPPPLRFPLEVPGQFRGPGGVPLAISQTGEWIAWIPGGQDAPIWVRRAGETEFRVLAGTEGANYPTFSPDEAWIAFSRNDGLFRVAPTGGPVLPVVPAVLGRGGSHPNWAADGTIVFAGQEGIYRVAGTGGEATPIVTVEELGFRPIRPELLPGGRGLLVTRGGSGGIVLVDLGSRRSTVLSEFGTHPHYLPTGHIIFGVDPAALMAMPFDLDRLEARGDAVTVLTGVLRSGGTSGNVRFAVSRTGVAIYATGGDAAGQRELVLVDLQGNTQVLPVRAVGMDAPRFSPDGKRIAYHAETDIWVFDTVLGSNTRLTFDGGNVYPAWSRSGEHIYYGTVDEAAVYRKEVAGGAAPERLVAPEAGQFFPRFESVDGSKVMIRANAGATGRDLLLLDLADATVTPWLTGDYNEVQPALSPDGRWVAYVADPAGRNEIFVRSFPRPGEPFQISDAGGTAPVWGPDGDVIYYRAPGAVLTAADVRADRGVTVVGRRAVAGEAVATCTPGNPNVRSYDIAPDGSRFVCFRNVGGSDPAEEADPEARPTITVVVNWFTELKAMMGAEGGR